MLDIELDGVEISSFEGIPFHITWYTSGFNLANAYLTRMLFLPLRSD
jgi:hypothetical protein